MKYVIVFIDDRGPSHGLLGPFSKREFDRECKGLNESGLFHSGQTYFLTPSMTLVFFEYIGEEAVA